MAALCPFRFNYISEIQYGPTRKQKVSRWLQNADGWNISECSFSRIRYNNIKENIEGTISQVINTVPILKPRPISFISRFMSLFKKAYTRGLTAELKTKSSSITFLI